MSGLPRVLEREPLIDAIFEVRLSATTQLPEILPGILFSNSAERPALQRLSTSDIPNPIRSQDPNLVHAPLVRMEFSQYTISLGDRSLIVGCKLPYPKWPAFKSIILNVVDQIVASGISGQIQRYSLKYVNVIEAKSSAEQLSKVQLDVKVGSHVIDDHQLHIRTELFDNDAVHVLSITNGARVNFDDGRTLEGIVIEVDSIRNKSYSDFTSFRSGLDLEIETLRQANKIHFFDCLKQHTIDEMGPKYE